jgi:hypothetical protein
MSVPCDELTLLEPGDNPDHRLRRNERSPRQLGIGQTGLFFERCQHCVLRCGQTDHGQGFIHSPP